MMTLVASRTTTLATVRPADFIIASLSVSPRRAGAFGSRGGFVIAHRKLHPDHLGQRAESQRLVGDRAGCLKIEYGRLSGEIGWQGINSRILSSKKPVLAGKGFQKLTIHRPGT